MKPQLSWPTHLIALVVLVLVNLEREARDFGVAGSGPWVDPQAVLTYAIIGALLAATVGALVAVVEVVAGWWQPWAARAVGVAYVFGAMTVATWPMDFRLFGDRSPAERADVTSFVVAFAVMVVVQLGLVAVVGRGLGATRRAAHLQQRRLDPVSAG